MWAVIQGYIIKGKLTKEQDAHLKATNTNALLTSENRETDKELAQTDHKLRMSEKEVRDLQAKLEHAEADRIELRAERATLENQLAASKRVRNAKGVFVRKDGTYSPKVKPLPTIADEVDDEIIRGNGLTDAETVRIAEAIAAQPKPHTLRHGMTVKNPTEKEAKEIFEAARVAGIYVYRTQLSDIKPNIWYGRDEVTVCVSNPSPPFMNGSIEYITPSEFIAHMQPQSNVK